MYWQMTNLSDNSPDLARNLAHHLLELRRRRALTQAGLARLAGVPRSTITHLESGRGNPSLLNLARVAGALQVSIEELLSPPRAQTQLIRARDLPVERRSQGAALIYGLLPDALPGMAIDRMELEPGARMAGVPHTSGTREYLTCMQGELTVYVAGEKHRLSRGDVLAFPGDRPHSYQNTGAARAVGISVVALAPPGTRSGP